MNVYALQTARANSKSVVDKNLLLVSGLPMYMHSIRAAQASLYIKDVYSSTDCRQIIYSAGQQHYKIIKRKESLCQDDSSHHETIIDGLLEIEKDISDTVDILVVLLGNTMGADGDDIDRSIEKLLDHPFIDSIQSVSEFNMFNPFRALRIRDGCLENMMSKSEIIRQSRLKNVNDKDSAGKTYFFNGSFWTVRREVLMRTDGNPPFPWLGKIIMPCVQNVCMELDAGWQLPLFK